MKNNRLLAQRIVNSFLTFLETTHRDSITGMSIDYLIGVVEHHLTDYEKEEQKDEP